MTGSVGKDAREEGSGIDRSLSFEDVAGAFFVCVVCLSRRWDGEHTCLPVLPASSQTQTHHQSTTTTLHRDRPRQAGGAGAGGHAQGARQVRQARGAPPQRHFARGAAGYVGWLVGGWVWVRSGMPPIIHPSPDRPLLCALRSPSNQTNTKPTTVNALTLTGTGKTLLARVMAAEAGVPFIYCSGSDFVEMYIGRYVVDVHGWVDWI